MCVEVIKKYDIEKFEFHEVKNIKRDDKGGNNIRQGIWTFFIFSLFIKECIVDISLRIHFSPILFRTICYAYMRWTRRYFPNLSVTNMNIKKNKIKFWILEIGIFLCLWHSALLCSVASFNSINCSLYFIYHMCSLFYK